MGNNLSQPQWAELIKQKRAELGETQAEFAKRFNVQETAVSHWETGRREAPYAVTWWLTHEGKLGE
jgi:DNA-binding transcriptional regulator YiaG